MTTFRQQQFEIRERAIIDAMYKLLIEKGYASTSMDDVAANLGISKPTLYIHFKSKTELALKVIIQQIDEVEASIRSFDPSLSAADRLKRTLYVGIQRRATMGAARIDLLPPEAYENPAFKAADRRVAKASNALIEEAQREGAIRTDIPVVLIQEFITNIFDMDFGRLTKDGSPVEELCNQITDLVLRAIQPVRK